MHYKINGKQRNTNNWKIRNNIFVTQDDDKCNVCVCVCVRTRECCFILGMPLIIETNEKKLVKFVGKRNLILYYDPRQPRTHVHARITQQWVCIIFRENYDGIIYNLWPSAMRFYFCRIITDESGARGRVCCVRLCVGPLTEFPRRVWNNYYYTLLYLKLQYAYYIHRRSHSLLGARVRCVQRVIIYFISAFIGNRF